MNNSSSVKLTAATPADVAPAAAAYSRANPGKYITVTVDFGDVRAVAAARLGVYSPTDSWGEHYWLNGKAKPFTRAQRAADWQASPVSA